MSIPTDPKDRLNDDDIHALLNSTHSTTPPALDQAILSAAREAVANEQETSTNQEFNKAKRWYSYWPQGLSAAAVVVLAVLLVPLMVSTPESSLELASEAPAFSVAESSLVVEADAIANTRTLSEPRVQADASAIAEAESISTLSSGALVQQKSNARTMNSTAGVTAGGKSVGAVSFDSQAALVSLLDGSKHKSEGGQGWRLTFDGNRFSWTHLNGDVSGTYKFVAENLFTVQLPDRVLTIKLSAEGLLWDGVNYLPE